MSMKEYIVNLNKDVDYMQFWQEMESSTVGLPFVPDRAVQIANDRPGSERSTHYYLTPEEAELLRQDPRVRSVGIPPEQNPLVRFRPSVRQNNNFSKPSSGTDSTGNNVNWGLTRMNAASSALTPLFYNYTLDGTGVDIVITDSGIEANHPEFQDAFGVSRVKKIDWYAESGLPGTQHPNHYSDYSGHGTHVAATAAGKTYGWAKNAHIYSIKIEETLDDQLDVGSGISWGTAFDAIKLWHQRKPVDPITGKKRPTIVNASWGLASLPIDLLILALVDLYGTTDIAYKYRGNSGTVNITNSSILDNIGLVRGRSDCIPHYDDSVNSTVDELIDAGITLCFAAGNDSYKIDVAGGTDYNNYILPSTEPDIIDNRQYYHRGSSPSSPAAITVGNIDSVRYSSSLDQRAVSSNTGPGVTVWAPGTDIRAAISQTYDPELDTHLITGHPAPYFLDTNWKQSNMTGTSMASPQIAGLCALYLQTNPGASPAEVKTWLINNAKTDVMYSTGRNNDYTDFRSLLGGPARFAYNPLSNYSISPVTIPVSRASQPISKQFSSPGVYEIVVPIGVKSTVRYHLWGAGGGSGGVDGNGPAGNGAAGAYNSGTISVAAGDVIRIAVGEGGLGGGSSTGGGHGRGGRSLQGFSGGRGGNAGGRGWSGGGGGGGGATVIQINSSTVAAAGGGGGGGGGSHNRAATSGSNTQSVISATYGQQGQDMPGDGGGGGGGGGGLQGGAGGAYGPDNAYGGRGGYTGLGGRSGNGITPAVTNIEQWRSPAGQGGNGAGASGKPGLAVLVFEPLGLGKVKDQDAWRDIEAIWVKDNDEWKPVVGVWVKNQGTWKEIGGAAALSLTPTTENRYFG